MRGCHHIGQFGQRVVRGRRFVFQHIQAGAGDAAVPQRRRQGGFVHDAAARRVDEDSRRLHQRQLRGGNHMAGFRGEGDMDADHVGGLQQRVQGYPADTHSFLLGGAQGGIFVVILEIDFKAAQPAGHFLGDVADAHQPDGFALQLVGVNAAVAGGAPAAGFHHCGVVIQAPIDGQHQHNGVFGDGHGVGAAVVGDGDAQIGGQFQVHPVVAGAQQLQQPHLWGVLQHPVGEPAGEQEQEIGVPRQFNLGVLVQAVGGGDDIHSGGGFANDDLPVFVVQVGQENYFGFGHCDSSFHLMAPGGRIRRGSRRNGRRSLCGK